MDLVPLSEIDAGLTRDVADHRVIQALWQRGLDGLVTCDESMLWLPEVIAMIEQTAFSVVACRESGHDALKASGLLLTQLSHVAKRHVRARPQLWVLAAAERRPKDFREHLADVERRSAVKIGAFHLTPDELRHPVLGGRAN